MDFFFGSIPSSDVVVHPSLPEGATAVAPTAVGEILAPTAVGEMYNHILSGMEPKKKSIH